MTVQRYNYVKALEELITKMDRVNKTPCKNASARFSKNVSQLKLNAQAAAIGVSALAKDVIMLLGVTLATPLQLKIQIVRILLPTAFQDLHANLDRMPSCVDQLALIVIDILGIAASTSGIFLCAFKGSEWNVAMQKGLYAFSSPKPLKPATPAPKPAPKAAPERQLANPVLVSPKRHLATPVNSKPQTVPPITPNPVASKLQSVRPPPQSSNPPAAPNPAASKQQAVRSPTQSSNPPGVPNPAASKQQAVRSPTQSSNQPGVPKQQAVQPVPKAAPHAAVSKQQVGRPLPKAAPIPAVSKLQPVRPVVEALPQDSGARPSRQLPSTPPGQAHAAHIKLPAASAVDGTPPPPQSVPLFISPLGELPAAGQLALSSPPRLVPSRPADIQDDLTYGEDDAEDGEEEAKRIKETKERLSRFNPPAFPPLQVPEQRTSPVKADAFAAMGKDLPEAMPSGRGVRPPAPPLPPVPDQSTSPGKADASTAIGNDLPETMPSGGRVRLPTLLLPPIAEQTQSPTKADDLGARGINLRRTRQEGEKSPRSKKEDELKRIAEEEKQAKRKADPLVNSALLEKAQHAGAAQRLTDSGESDWS